MTGEMVVICTNTFSVRRDLCDFFRPNPQSSPGPSFSVRNGDVSRTGKFFVVMRIDLPRDPTVVAMAISLKVRPEVVVGYLHSVWGWFAEQTEDGRVFGVSIEALELATNLSGFPQLMENHGWLKEWKDDEGQPSLMIPNWERWFGGQEARKEYERNRKRNQRKANSVPDKRGTSVGQKAGQSADDLRPQEQEQEQEQRVSEWPYQSQEFLTAWKSFLTGARAHGRSEIQTDLDLKELFAMQNEAEAIKMVEYSVRNSNTGRLLDHKRYAKPEPKTRKKGRLSI